MAIARQLRRLSPNAEIVFLTSNEAAAFCLKEGFAAFKVPSRSAREAGRIRASLYAKLVQSVTWSLVTAFDPHLLLVDSFPAGAIQELLPLLRWNMLKVFVYRERHPAAAADSYFQNVLAQYQLVLIPHAPGEVDLPLPPGLETCAVGPVLLRDREDALPREAARAALAGASEGLVCYVNFGGGGDPAAGDAIGATLEALSRHRSIRPVVAPGPLANGLAHAPPGCNVVQHYPIAPYFSGVDLAISAAGYNTHAELLHFGVPTAFVAFDKGIDDQEARVARTVARGAGLAVGRLARDDFDRALAQLLDPACRQRLREAGQRMVPSNGAAIAAKRILELLA
jgi:UDP:flavonoid glycosyltransferase YjiC (YdhE family)